MITLACIVCKRNLESVDSKANNPSDGTVFISYGNYGSTVWDPIGGGEFLKVNICDPCLVDAVKQGWVLQGKTVVTREVIEELWDGVDEFMEGEL